MNRKRILLIDDDEVLCEGMAYVLKDEGYLVESTSDTAQGSELIGKYTFDIAILDYKMPGMNGAEMTKKIKEKSPNTAIFIVSGWPAIGKFLEEDKVTHLLAGIMGKPFTEKDLMDMLAQVP